MKFDVRAHFQVVVDDVQSLRAESLGAVQVTGDDGPIVISDPVDALAVLISARLNGVLPQLFESVTLATGVRPEVHALKE